MERTGGGGWRCGGGVTERLRVEKKDAKGETRRIIESFQVFPLQHVEFS